MQSIHVLFFRKQKVSWILQFQEHKHDDPRKRCWKFDVFTVGAKQDVFETCEVIDEIAKCAMDGIRFIQIHKTGVDLLRVYKVL